MSKEKLLPRFEDFAYRGDQTPEEDAIIEGIVANRRRTYALTGDDHGDVEQRLATFLTEPPVIKGPEILTRGTAFTDDNGRMQIVETDDGEELEPGASAYFDAHVAYLTGRRVIAANVPGVDFRKTGDPDFQRHQELTPSQKEQLKDKGGEFRFRKIGEATMVAIDNAAAEFGISERIYVPTFSSMAVAVGAGALRAAFDRGITIAGVSINEPVNHVHRKESLLGYAAFLKQFGDNTSLAKQYVAHNPELLKANDTDGDLDWILRVKTDLAANVAYGQALAGGSFYHDLGNRDGIREVPVIVTRGAASELSPGHVFDHFANSFEGNGNVTRIQYGLDENGDMVSPHNHPYTMTVQQVADAANDVLERIA